MKDLIIAIGITNIKLSVITLNANFHWLIEVLKIVKQTLNTLCREYVVLPE